MHNALHSCHRYKTNYMVYAETCLDFNMLRSMHIPHNAYYMVHASMHIPYYAYYMVYALTFLDC